MVAKHQPQAAMLGPDSWLTGDEQGYDRVGLSLTGRVCARTCKVPAWPPGHCCWPVPGDVLPTPPPQGFTHGRMHCVFSVSVAMAAYTHSSAMAACTRSGAMAATHLARPPVIIVLGSRLLLAVFV